MVVDVTSEKSCHEMVSAVESFGRFDILVNNAGINIRKPPQDYTLAEWNRSPTNLTSTSLAARPRTPEMLKAGGGKIINIGSMVSIFGIILYAGVFSEQRGHVNSRARWPRPGPRTISRSIRFCPAGSTRR